MTHIILETAKFLSILEIILYTLTSVFGFKERSQKAEKRRFHRQRFHIFFFQFLCYLQLIIISQRKDVVIFYLIQFAFFQVMLSVICRIYQNISKDLLYHMFFLMMIGLTVQTRLSMKSFAKKQFVIIVGFLLLTLLLPKFIITCQKLKDWKWVYGIGGLLLLCTVFVFGVTKYGATNWIRIAGISIQPSEFVKILFIFFVASMLGTNLSLKKIFVTTAVAAVHVLILVAERDLGGALIFFIVYLILLYTATGKKIYIIGGLLAGSVAAVFAYKLFDHVKTRVEVWKNPWPLIDGKGYQITQSLFAIGTGSWFGMGLGQGRPMDIPVRQSDFIFSAISEEFGAIVAMCIILICICCFIRMLQVAMYNKLLFNKLLAMGFGVCYIFQVFLTIGGEVKFIPSTGVTLPFVSYGGSSIASTVIIFSVVQALCMIGKSEVIENAEER